MDEILKVISNDNIPLATLVILIGLLLIFLGSVNKLYAIEVPADYKLRAIFSGGFIVCIGLILYSFAPSNEHKTPIRFIGNNSSGNDMRGRLLFNTEEECIKECDEDKKCVAVAISIDPGTNQFTNECWLKNKLNESLTTDTVRGIIIKR